MDRVSQKANLGKYACYFITRAQERHPSFLYRDKVMRGERSGSAYLRRTT